MLADPPRPREDKVFTLRTNPLPAGRPLGEVLVPGSKSVTNRALLLAAQCPGVSRLRGGLEASDTRWMRRILLDLGIQVGAEDGCWTLQGGQAPVAKGPLWVGASGTTLRFLLPWLALRATTSITFIGEPRLFERPLSPLFQALEPLGARWESAPQGGILHPVPDPPRSLNLQIDARQSSQFLTGLALAAAGLPEGGRLRWRGEAASSSYLDLTNHWLQRFGCAPHLDRSGWIIPGGHLTAQDLDLPGDWSGAAAFLCAAALTDRPLRIGPLDCQDPQGDRALVGMLAEAGCQAHWQGHQLTLTGKLNRGFQVDLTQCPDLGPVLAAAAALAPGDSLLTGLETLPLKECDRLEASADLVRWLGGQAENIEGHALRIRPGSAPGSRPPFDPRNDHRMAFAAAVGALQRGGELLDSRCVGKTFPTFWETWDAMLDGLG